MPMNFSFLQTILQGVLKPISEILSEEIKRCLKELISHLELKAKQTTNPWDDFFVSLLKQVLGIEK